MSEVNHFYHIGLSQGRDQRQVAAHMFSPRTHLMIINPTLMIIKVTVSISTHLPKSLIHGRIKIKDSIRCILINIGILEKTCGMNILGLDHHRIRLITRLDRLSSILDRLSRSLNSTGVRNTHMSRFGFQALLDNQCPHGRMDDLKLTHWRGETAQCTRHNPEGTPPNML